MSDQRPSWDETFMGFAHALAKRSTCARLSVGCVITSLDNHMVLAMGYNGGARGVFNDCLSEEPGACGHLHAEINALLKLNYDPEGRRRMYVTVSPCRNCAVAIINSRIQEVIFDRQYRNTSGLEMLEKGGVPVRKFSYTPDEISKMFGETK